MSAFGTQRFSPKLPGSVAVLQPPIPQAAGEREWAEGGEAAEHGLFARVAFGLAHDLNNFLAGSLLYCDLLRERLGPDHELLGHVERISFTSEQAAELAAQLLNLGRRGEESPEGCDVAGAVAELLDLLVRLMSDGIELECEIEPGVGRARVSEVKLQRVLLNLVLNARDAMPEGGRIRIRALRLDPAGRLFRNRAVADSSSALPFVLLEVSDTGRGMDAATRARAWEPFFSCKSSECGYGLGLVSVREVVSGCGGELTMESCVGLGTTVRVFLPLEQSLRAGSGPIGSPSREPGKENERKNQ